jgi:transcriptional regulator EpsA
MHTLGDVASESDFIAWSKQAIQQVLPHEMMHCYFGVMANGRLVPHKWLKKSYPDVCMTQFQDARGTVMTPFMKSSFAERQVQLFEPERDAARAHMSLHRFHQYELRNIAAHVQSDALTGLTSYFSFSRIPGSLNAKHGHTLALLVPQMHAALNRIVGREHEREGDDEPAAAPQLTRREMEVLDWIKEGKTNWEIAQILNCSATTVKTHLQRIFAKMGVHSRAKAAALWACKAPASLAQAAPAGIRAS